MINLERELVSRFYFGSNGSKCFFHSYIAFKSFLDMPKRFQNLWFFFAFIWHTYKNFMSATFFPVDLSHKKLPTFYRNYIFFVKKKYFKETAYIIKLIVYCISSNQLRASNKRLPHWHSDQCKHHDPNKKQELLIKIWK